MRYGYIWGKWGLLNLMKVPEFDQFAEIGPLLGGRLPLENCAKEISIPF